jgi:hypothetical protein
MASGRVVPLWALATAWLAVFVLSFALAGRERSLPGITAALLSGQLALHTLFRVAQSDGGAGAGAAPGAAPGTASGMTPGAGTADGAVTHQHTDQLQALAERLLCASSGAGRRPLGNDEAVRVVRDAGIDPHAYADALPSGHLCSTLPTASSMLVAHVLAALAAGWFLRRGEAALWRLVRLTARAAELSRFPLRSALALVRALLNGLLGTVRLNRPVLWEAEPPAPVSVLLQHCVVRRGPPAYALAA